MISVLNVVSLDELRQHLRIDHHVEDSLIEVYAQAALDWCLQFCERPEWVTPEQLPMAVKASVLLMTADLYLNRVSQVEAKLYQNETVERLLWPYRGIFRNEDSKD